MNVTTVSVNVPVADETAGYEVKLQVNPTVYVPATSKVPRDLIVNF